MIDEKKLIEDIWKQSNNHTTEWSTGGILALIEKQPQVDKWIPCVSGVIPEENIEVWVTVEELDGSCYTQGSWLQEGQWVIKKTPLEPKVIAWMPKPQPYKKEGNSNENT